MNKNKNTIRRQAFHWISSAFLALNFTCFPVNAQQATSPHAAAVGLAMDLVRQDQWVAADLAAAVAGRTARDIVEWHRLRDGDGEFVDYLHFLRANPDWPGLALLREKGEAAITDQIAADEITRYFAEQLPRTGTGSLYLAGALESLGKSDLAEIEIRHSWQEMDLTTDEEALFLSRYGDLLDDMHADRVSNLLWNGRYTAAGRLSDLLSAGQRALFEARVALRRGRSGVDELIGKVPADLQEDPGLAYDRFRWRLSNGKRSGALELLAERSLSPASLGKPEKWASQRRWLARDLMREGQAKTAYKVASEHHLTSGTAYSDLEWLSGFIALSDLGDAETALGHFRKFRASVFSPISLGRAGYWEGRALEKLGRDLDARAAYALAAEFQTSFYGQLAAERIDILPDVSLAGARPYPDPVKGEMATSTVLQAALLLKEADETLLFRRFLRHLAETLDEEQRGGIGDLAVNAGSPYTALYLAKYAASEGQTLIRPYYPLPDWVEKSFQSPKSLVLSVARRESEFNSNARSSAGARGLLQLMPETARRTARKHSLSLQIDDLTENPDLNLTLGDLYLNELIDEFDGYIPFAVAGYNAGPGRISTWIDQIGPRGQRVEEVVDWIEHIPFTETRNYVMRVTESVFVYEARLAGKTGPFLLGDILTGRWPAR